MERSWPFTRGYGVGGDLTALLSEYGVILSLTLIVYLVLELLKKR